MDDYSYGYSKYGAKTAEEANIAIAYEEGNSTKGGYWYDKKTGKKVADQYVAHVKIYAIRLDNWTLIDQKALSETLQKGSSGTTAISMVKSYDINYLCENGHFQTD